MKTFRTILGAILTATAVAMLLIVGLATAGSAHTGNVNANATCDGWSVTVVLDHNTTADRTVNVVSTIPGHPGFTGHHYGTDKGTIFTASGPEHNLSGTVTLTITPDAFTDSASISPAQGCTPVPVETVTVCREGKMVTIPAGERVDTDLDVCPVVTPSVPTDVGTPATYDGVPVAPPATPIHADPASTLAFTGSSSWYLAAIGLGLIVAGFAYEMTPRATLRRELRRSNRGLLR